MYPKEGPPYSVRCVVYSRERAVMGGCAAVCVSSVRDLSSTCSRRWRSHDWGNHEEEAEGGLLMRHTLIRVHTPIDLTLLLALRGRQHTIQDGLTHGLPFVAAFSSSRFSSVIAGIRAREHTDNKNSRIHRKRVAPGTQMPRVPLCAWTMFSRVMPRYSRRRKPF